MNVGVDGGVRLLFSPTLWDKWLDFVQNLFLEEKLIRNQTMSLFFLISDQ